MSENPYSEYYLAKWSRYIRIRDNFICQMCLEKATSKRKIQAHHLDRKYDCPEKALDLNNGVSLCETCHLRIVHSTHKNHKQFRVIFKRVVSWKRNEEFERKYQDRLKYRNV
jgi:5-methylcytosine-specific restriction endonuclease McrA